MSRLRELARAGAFDEHLKAVMKGRPDHLDVDQGNDFETGFLVCPHPDCVLVRAPEAEAAPLVSAPPAWQDISTAPKDRSILVVHYGRVFIATHRKAGNGFPARWDGPDADDFTFSGPTHWMPLPDPPSPATLNTEPEV